MKKITLAVISTIALSLSANVFACPKGTTLQGGVGPKHKGGKCVPKIMKDQKVASKTQSKKDKKNK